MLLQANRLDGAVYLCGYAVELALKARSRHGGRDARVVTIDSKDPRLKSRRRLRLTTVKLRVQSTDLFGLTIEDAIISAPRRPRPNLALRPTIGWR